MKRETYLNIINDTPLYYDFEDVRTYLSGIYAVAGEDNDITQVDMLVMTFAGDKVKARALGSED